MSLKRHRTSKGKPVSASAGKDCMPRVKSRTRYLPGCRSGTSGANSRPANRPAPSTTVINPLVERGRAARTRFPQIHVRKIGEFRGAAPSSRGGGTAPQRKSEAVGAPRGRPPAPPPPPRRRAEGPWGPVACGALAARIAGLSQVVCCVLLLAPRGGRSDRTSVGRSRDTPGRVAIGRSPQGVS